MNATLFLIYSNDVLTTTGSKGMVHTYFEETIIMSMHRSLKSASKIATKRNVLKRYERVDVLQERGQWKPGDKVYGLRKTKPPV